MTLTCVTPNFDMLTHMASSVNDQSLGKFLVNAKLNLFGYFEMNIDIFVQ